MITGARLTAPEGFLHLSKGITYYFLINDSVQNRVRLIEFTDHGKELKALLVKLTAIEFEEALEAGFIREENAAAKFPPWLEPIQGVAIPHLENRRFSSKESYDQKVNRRFLAISELVPRIREILISDNPDAIINAHAKAQRPQQNAGRLRQWFYTYIAFGQNKWALLPPLHRIGGWNRESPTRTRKLGRPSPRGKRAGYNCDSDMKGKIRSGFIKYKSPYKTWNTIYREMLTKEFGCISAERHGNFTFHHPEGLPFPSFPQMRYWIKKLFSSRVRSIAVRGQHKTRALFADQGSFSERLFNVNQSVEFDGYNISEKITGLLEGSAVDSFCVVRAVCALSGMIVGIGFSEGAENMEAYKNCLYSMAVDKVKYCELFGVDITPDQWPCEGVSGGIVFDRGPGANFETDSQINWLGTLENTPVFSGQSKASIESSHPRDKKTLDQPTYFHSKLNFVTMARREIYQVLADNMSSNAGDRMEECMYTAGVKPTPLGVWNYWSGRGRNSSIGMLFDTAIRTFLSKHPAVIRQDALYFYGRKYRSDELVATGVFDRVARTGVIPVQVYALSMCVRHIWVEVEGILFELDMVRSQRTVQGDIDISLRDLQEIDRLRRESLSTLREEQPAVHQYVRDKFKQEADEHWDSGERKLGRVSRSGAAQRDMADYNRFRGKSK